MAKKRDYDHLFKLLLIGDSGVGKPTLLRTFREGLPAELTYEITIGIDFIIRTLDVDGQRVKLQVWDTAGQERFQTITTAYFRGACGCLLVYDVRNRDSFTNISKWLRTVEEHCSSDDVIKILVGNDNAASESESGISKAVSTEEAQTLAEQCSMPLFEIDPTDKALVEEMFHAMASMILRTRKAKDTAEAVTVSADNSTQSNCLI